MSDRRAFLGVSSSLTGRRWVGPTAEQTRAAEALEQSTGHPMSLCSTLARLGVTPEEASGYLDPKIRDLLPDPLSLKDMGTAAERFQEALAKRQRIAIFADYDVDGGSSAAILIDWLRAMDHTATLYVPDRIKEGYGPNVPAMSALASDHDLIVCVDCGTLSHAPIAAATSAADVIVLDHHLGGETLPDACAVVNPNRQDETGEIGHLCAAAVVFLFLVEVNRRMRSLGETGPDLMQLLDLVALATVADVAPLVGVNRALVRQGLKVLGGRARPGLAALADVAGVDSTPNAYHLGFILGPRVNAGGRIGQADIGARLLATNDLHEAAALAERLDRLNRERRDIEARVLAEAQEQIGSLAEDRALVWAASDGWHPGVVGIVASRLKEQTNRPSVVIGFDGRNGKGSGRSVSGADLGQSVQRLVAEGLLSKGGGHRMAAGLSVDREQLEPAMKRLEELLRRQGAHLAGPRDVTIDAVVQPTAVTPELISTIETAGPFGASAAAPRFAMADVRVRYAKRVGEKHLRVTLSGIPGGTIDGIVFGAFDTPLGSALESSSSAPIHVAGQLEINTWGGRSKAQLRVEDAATAD